MVSDEDLIKGCINENRTSQNTLYQQYSGKMLSVARRYSRHYMEAEDILQDAFMKIFDKIEMHNPQKGSLEGWMRRIVINIALKKIDRLSFKNEAIGLGEDDYLVQSTDPKIFSQLSVEELMKLISELPDGYRAVFNMNVIDGYKHKEIAAILGCTESNSRSQLTKARKLLQIKVLDMQSINL